MTSKNLTVDNTTSTSLPADIRVSRLAPSAKGKARKTRDTSGRKCLELLHSKDPLLSLLKMLLATSRWDSTPYAMIWKAKATPHGRLIFQRALLERPTKETGYGWWRTPLASVSSESWVSLEARVQRLKSAGNKQVGSLVTLTQQVQKAHGRTDGVPNPEFAGWLMGYPTRWTEIEPTETPSSRK